MKAFVLDASLALEWFTTSASRQALAKRALFDDRVAVVPHLWRFEVMNVITTWTRSKYLSRAEASFILNDVTRLPFAIVDEGSPEAVIDLAVAQQLSAYDASYLHAAMVIGEPLATLDSRLIKAAHRVGVQCV